MAHDLKTVCKVKIPKSTFRDFLICVNQIVHGKSEINGPETPGYKDSRVFYKSKKFKSPNVKCIFLDFQWWIWFHHWESQIKRLKIKIDSNLIFYLKFF